VNSTRPFPIGWTAGILLLLSVGLAGWAFNQRQHAQAETDKRAKAHSLLISLIKRARSNVDRKRPDATSMKAPVQLNAQAIMPNGRPDIEAIVFTHPDLLAMYVKAARSYLDQTYGPTFARLNLSPDQIERLDTLLIDDAENQVDLNATAQSLGLANNDPVISKEREMQAADLQAAELTVLGQQAYEAFDAVFRQESIRGTVEQVSTMTVFSDHPITGGQSGQLVQLMAQSSTDYANGKEATATTVDWSAVLAGASTFLAPSQVASLHAEAQRIQFRNLAKKYVTEQASSK
jgi:hypothetical protein